MSMEIITGYTGIEHVTSADDASLHRGILGTDDYVLEVGSKFAATIIDNNTVRVMDGDLVIQGHQARIRANDYEELTINNGVMGEKRHDLIVARYEKDTDTGIESIDLIVKEGQSGEAAQDPTVEIGDVSQGATVREFALYRVKLDGLSITNVEKLFNTSKTLKDLATHMAENVSDNAHGLYDRFNNMQIVKYGSDPGVVIDEELTGNLYLLLIGRDNGVYFISKFEGDCFITGVEPMTNIGSIEIIETNLIVDFSTRTRHYALLRIY